jgi:hypothetical protein
MIETTPVSRPQRCSSDAISLLSTAFTSPVLRDGRSRRQRGIAGAPAGGRHWSGLVRPLFGEDGASWSQTNSLIPIARSARRSYRGKAGSAVARSTITALATVLSAPREVMTHQPAATMFAVPARRLAEGERHHKSSGSGRADTQRRGVGTAGLTAAMMDDPDDGHMPTAGDPQYQRVNEAGDGSDHPSGVRPKAKGIPGRAGRCHWTCCGGGAAVRGRLEDRRFPAWCCGHRRPPSMARSSGPFITRDERRAGNVTGEPARTSGRQRRGRPDLPGTGPERTGFRAGSSGAATCPGRRSGSARRCGRPRW